MIGLIAAVLVLIAGVAEAHTKATWNCNTEPDMKQYNVYACLATGCTPGTFSKVATVPHTAGCTTSTWTLTPGTQGSLKVRAEDTAANESADSNVATFDANPPKAVTVTVE